MGTPGRPAGGADEVYFLVQDLRISERREHALLELSKRRESLTDLAPILWHSFGTIVALIQEIVCIYPQLSPPPSLTAPASNRVCNSLALLQCVASHPDTRPLFLKAHIPLLLYPFLNTVSKDRPFEYLRLTSLGVIGALVKVDDVEVINFLLQTEIIPLCLRIMETGSELSKTVATFIVQKLLLDDMGLTYICATAERFYAYPRSLRRWSLRCNRHHQFVCLSMSSDVTSDSQITRGRVKLCASASQSAYKLIPPYNAF